MIIEKLDTTQTAFELFQAFKEDPYCFLLDSSMENKRLGRFSFMGSKPFLVMKSKGRRITLKDKKKETVMEGNPFDVLQDLLKKYKLDDSCDIPFCGGAVGYFAYDMCHHIEKLTTSAVDDIDLPDCYFGFYDCILAVDHQQNKVYSIATGLNENPEDALQAMRNKLQYIGEEDGLNQEEYTCGEIVSNFSKDNYMKAVQRIKDYISTGDIYQVNLTQRFSCETKEPPLCLYTRLRSLNPAPFACYIDFAEGQILSSSPERFLKLQQNLIETRPIKGTRPRGKTPEEDIRNKSELINSEKDQSELLMIVDLLRNDVGRVSKAGTVKVPELFYPEEYATVHHLVSTVTGEMSPGLDVIDVVKAAFPGGSITGAPKIRAMEIIDELEPTKRNIYTGSIGYIGFNGATDLNIAIRTIIMKNSKAYFQAGGGIVWDSEPQLEYEECLHKAKALFKALKNEK